MNWVVAADHGGVELKAKLASFLVAFGFHVEDLGGFDAEANDAYPEDADRLVEPILKGEAVYGVLICGSGIGISMRANRYKGIRAALVHNEFTAKSAKAHNNANVLCFGARVLCEEEALQCLKAFIETDFEGGRHIPRVEKLDAPLVNHQK